MSAAKSRARIDSSGAPSGRSSPLVGIVWLLGGAFGAALATQTILTSPEQFAGFGSRSLWTSVVSALGASPEATPAGSAAAAVSLTWLWFLISCALLVVVALGMARRTSRAGVSRGDRFGRVARGLGLWCLVPAAWEALRLAAFTAGWSGGESFLSGTSSLFFALGIAGALTTLLSTGDGAVTTSAATDPATPPNRNATLTDNAPDDPAAVRRHRLVVVAAALTYAVVFTAMNWQLYRGLLVPHGDTAMYEEHLWNLLHGNGFRSYLDQGLFLGEHLQVIHILLIPLYMVWPSHLLLELCSSAALAAGAFPVYFLARRRSGSSAAGMWLAAAYLLAMPMQFLDIAIDLKTFRPTSFVIPLLLAALDQWERGRRKTFVALLVVVLSAQEDLALVLAPLGVWMALTAWLGRRGAVAENAVAENAVAENAVAENAVAENAVAENAVAENAIADAARLRRQALFGTGIALASTAYLLLALLVVIPWFRAGAEVHYTAYFGDLGRSPGEIARSLFTKPGAFFGKLLCGRSLMYGLLLLVPYGLLPLRACGRLLVAAPLLGVLCLMETSNDPAKQGVELLVPWHHFHAPIVPILVWAAVASLGEGGAATRRARFACATAFATGLFFSLGPLSVAFWDAGSQWHWKTLYVPGQRAAMIDRVVAQIPTSARVASTDFVHPRFTHHERSYDYSAFRRKASGFEHRVPDDTDYIVLDTRHRYSTIKNPGDVRELNEEPKRWELVADRTEGHFIVLKRLRGRP